MIFAAPWVLLALLGLPVLWWLLRATPPAPRAQNFPAIRLLAGLQAREETPARTPWWLLALRLAACTLIILGIANPVRTSGGLTIPGGGPALLILDDGFASAPDFAARLQAGETILARLARENRPVALLTTAASPDGQAPHATGFMPANLLRPLLNAVVPKPWPVDRAQAASSILGKGPSFYITDSLASPGDAAFAASLAARGPLTVFTGTLPTRLLSATAGPDHLLAQLRQTPSAAARTENILAEATDGHVLARQALRIPAGATQAEATLDLPPELRNQLGALRLENAPGAGSVALLDESARRRPVGLVASGAGAETPLLGDLFYLERALGPTTELRHGDIATLLGRKLSMLIVTAANLSPDDVTKITNWVKQGGLLIRFASPGLAPADATSAPDPLLPEPLLPGGRQLGGAMSWSQPAHLAPFPASSPFAGLSIPPDVTISRQVLADPSGTPPEATWARLADGTPLVTAAHLGAGEIVLFHVTANADWSNLPLSGLFVAMLDRLVKLSAGIAIAEDARMLAPALALDGQGVLSTPPPAARPISARAMESTVPSPTHPPGFYGPERDRHALNLGSPAVSLAPLPALPHVAQFALDAAPQETPLGPWLIALALLLLAADMILTLRLRGLLDHLRRVAATVLLLSLIAPQAQAEPSQNPALATHLAYIITGDSAVDATSRAGLAGLSTYVNTRTAAVLAPPIAVAPGQDDLRYYPLLYFPITANASLSPAAISALNDYMHHGGIILIDLRGGSVGDEGSGAGLEPDTAAALRRIGKGLDIPRLAPLSNTHVLAHAFYLLNDFPGRYDGATVWVGLDQDRANDSVSPVIIGSNDWAAAWALDEDGQPLYATIPGGQRQRTLAFRFGVNAVMYALTGNYKGDQVHVPALLERLGQ